MLDSKLNNCCFSVFILAFFCLSFFQNESTALCRDYCVFYEMEDGVLEWDDVEYMDDNNDFSWIYYYMVCIDHFNKSYLPYWEPSLERCLPDIEKELLNLIPAFSVPDYSLYDISCKCKNEKRDPCINPVIYPGYLDIDFHQYDSFLEEQLIHFKSKPECFCYWSEHSVEAGVTSDLAYLLFRELLQHTALSKLIDDRHEQSYLLRNTFWNLNLHGLSVSCVCRSFWFSHYYRLSLELLKYAEQDYEKERVTFDELQYIHERITRILLVLAKRFEQVYSDCLEKHPSEKITEELEFLQCMYGLLPHEKTTEPISFLENGLLQVGKEVIDTTIEDRSLGVIQNFQDNSISIEGNRRGTSSEFFAEYYLYQGLFNNDVMQFSKAIELFDRSIKFDDQNKLAYLARAYAHFELRNYEQALDDYRVAKSLEITPPLLPGHVLGLPTWQVGSQLNRIEFGKGFTYGVMEGFNEGARTFVPSILHTVTGIAQGIWVFAHDPVNISRDFVDTVGLFVSLVEMHISDEELLDETISEVKELLDRWFSLTDFEKGRQIGFIIGKYGLDVFLIGRTTQLSRKCREFKYLHGELTLKQLDNAKNRKMILEQAEKKARARGLLFKDGKIKISWADQNKHFPDSPSYIEGRSFFTILREKLKELVEKQAGTGRAVQGRVIGEIGYKEVVDFGEIIGIYIKEEGKGNIIIKKSTQFGTIHYKKNGSLHVIPANPSQF